MIDPADIQKRYGAMSDDELIHFTKQEAASLTHSAFQVLKQEFFKRNLETEIITDIEDGSHFAEQARLRKIVRTVPGQSDSSAIGIALNEKRDGKNDETIIFHLMEVGMEEDKARIITAEIKSEAEVLVGKARVTMLTSVFAGCAGIALHLINPDKPVITFADILAGSAMFFGALRFLKGYFDFTKFKSIIVQVEKEKISEATTVEPD